MAQVPRIRKAALGTGESHSLADWPNRNVPRFGVGVYTIWHAVVARC
jgi:hypothetical protein